MTSDRLDETPVEHALKSQSETPAVKRADTVTRGGAQAMPFVTPAVYTIAEACAVARIGRSTLYKHIRAGNLRAIKIGSRTCIPIDELYRWLEAMPSSVSVQPPVPEDPERSAPKTRSEQSAVVQHRSEHSPHPDEQKTHQ